MCYCIFARISDLFFRIWYNYLLILLLSYLTFLYTYIHSMCMRQDFYICEKYLLKTSGVHLHLHRFTGF